MSIIRLILGPISDFNRLLGYSQYLDYWIWLGSALIVNLIDYYFYLDDLDGAAKNPIF